MSDMEFYDFDVGVSLTFTLTSGITAVNLSGYTATLIVGGYPNLINLTVISAASGVVGYTTSAKDFKTPGEFKCQILRSATGTKIHSSPFTVRVLKAAISR